MTEPFAVLEVAMPLPQTWPSRFEATLGRGGRAELLVVAPGAHVPWLRVLADRTDVSILGVLDAQAVPWAAVHAPDVADPSEPYVAHLVAEHLAHQP